MRGPTQRLATTFPVEGSLLHGMLDLPGQAARHDLGVLMLNSDDGCRLGPNRLWVYLAQRLAEAGYPCLRFDYRGCGDSEGPEGPPTADVALADTVAAEQHLRRQTCARATVLVGICYGAEIGLLASRCTPSVAGVVACSTGRYVTAEGYGKAINDAWGYVGSYKRKLLSWQSWRKLLRGQVHGRLILSGLWRTLSLSNRRRDRDGAAAAQSCATGANRKVPSLFVYGAADPLTAKYMAGYREDARRLGIDRRFHVIADANHNYSSVNWSGEVIRQVQSFVEELRPARGATNRADR